MHAIGETWQASVSLATLRMGERRSAAQRGVYPYAGLLSNSNDMLASHLVHDAARA
jgi:hypothetical protein